MNTSFRTHRFWPLLAALAAACGPGGSTPDASETGPGGDGGDAGDGGGQPDARPDVGIDAQPDVGIDAQPDVPRDAPPDVRGDVSADAGVCDGVPIENLNVLGTQRLGVLHYTGSNATSTATSSQGVQIPPESNYSSYCSYRIGHQRVFAYTVQNTSVLKVSTTNPGTSYGFNTALTVLDTPCAGAPQVLGCNDDDLAYNGDDRRISSTSVSFLEVQAGTTVYIGVGGFVPADGVQTNPEAETGTFELTVEEFTPRPDGASCDVNRLTDGCVDSTTCVSDRYPYNAGHCHPDGTVAGSLCVSGACTGTGLTCDPNSALCVIANVPVGQRCDPFNECGAGLACDLFQLGAVSGTCRTVGSAAGLPCRAGGLCDPGLACSVPGGPGVCLNAATAGGPCNTYDSVCPTGQTCVGGENLGTQGTCTTAGTTAGSACEPGGTCLGSGLACTTRDGVQQCTDTVATGGACSLFDVCAAGGSCFYTDPAERLAGQCFAPGSLGGACLGGGACNAGACSNGRCLAAGTLGGSCDLTTACPTGSSCVRQGSGTFAGTCLADGSAAGAGCRDTGTACDNGLACSSPYVGDGICQSAGTGACDPLGATIRCGSGQVCRSTGLATGTCAAATVENEPNDAVGTTIATVGAPAAVAGSLTIADIDCFGVAVPANGKLYAAATSPSGVCPGPLQIDVYRLSAGSLDLVGSDRDSSSFGCPRVDGTDAASAFDWARNLPAATYYVCLREQLGNPVNAYVLSLNATP